MRYHELEPVRISTTKSRCKAYKNEEYIYIQTNTKQTTYTRTDVILYLSLVATDAVLAFPVVTLLAAIDGRYDI